MVKMPEEEVCGGLEGPPPFSTGDTTGAFYGDNNYTRKMMENQFGFRLQELNDSGDLCCNKDVEAETITSVSEHSIYKQRIDSMFDDNRSYVSDRSRDFANAKTPSSSLSNLLEYYEHSNSDDNKNNIQEKIDKMFEEISLSGFQKNNAYRTSQNSLYGSVDDVISNDFKVVYLGSKSLMDKCVSLVTLQQPLKELFFNYKRENREETRGGHLLTISKEGLKIKNNDTLTLNPFPTIAVWASVKFSFRKGSNATEFAFLPLIKDPDGIDKNILYRQLSDEEKLIIGNAEQETSTSPIFSVVMKNTQDKMLECHAFICSSSEEAIVIAANLYQALMKKMNKPTTSSRTETDMTNTSESEREGKTTDSGLENSLKKSPPPVPSRPPRKISRERQPTEQVITELKETLDNISEQALLKKAHKNQKNVERRKFEQRVNKTEVTADGDILTKVAIPRSGSFLNANGPLTRYSRRYKMNGDGNNDVISPLGFNELFHEFRQNEGLESMDEILDAIIDAEGMSFNDLKPIYKEFLLKLAVTLTKDELFQRSKIIMRRQKKKNRSRSFRKTNFVSASGLKRVFRKTASKLSKPKCSRPATLEFTSVVFQSGSKNYKTSSTSTASSCGKKKEVRRKPSARRRLNKDKEKKYSLTSADSDCFLRRNGNESGGCPNRSSSGYFSCSECSYDSENCTCTSAVKCYCTLRNKNAHRETLSSCACDTDSCADSEKCYCTDKLEVKGLCQTPHLHIDQHNKIHNADCPNFSKCKNHSQTIIEQLKEQGFAASDSSLSRAASPTTAWRSNEEKIKKPKQCLQPSKSLEFLQMRPLRPESRQQIHECPPPPPEASKPKQNFVEGTRHYCYHGEDVNLTIRRRELPASYRTPRRPYSSMRARLPQNDLVTSKVRSRVFSSMRAKSVHDYDDNIMNHVLFPERNGSTTSSLRFTRRMDVYSSFQGRHIDTQGSYIHLLHQIQAKKTGQLLQHDTLGFPSITDNLDTKYSSSGGSDNFQKLDYDLFTGRTRSETSLSTNSSERKVLVVSARDTKGKVLYMGASTRGDGSKNVVKDKSAASASEALSVKKSAEIAALFSDVTTKQKAARPAGVKGSKPHSRTGSYRLSNMENTLGYLP